MQTKALPTLPNFDAHLAENKFGKMGKVETLCRIRQNGFRQTVLYSFSILRALTSVTVVPGLHKEP